MQGPPFELVLPAVDPRPMGDQPPNSLKGAFRRGLAEGKAARIEIGSALDQDFEQGNVAVAGRMRDGSGVSSVLVLIGKYPILIPNYIGSCARIEGGDDAGGRIGFSRCQKRFLGRGFRHDRLWRFIRVPRLWVPPQPF